MGGGEEQEEREKVCEKERNRKLRYWMGECLGGREERNDGNYMIEINICRKHPLYRITTNLCVLYYF